MNTWALLSKILGGKNLQIAKVIGYNDVYHTVEMSSGNIMDVKSEITYQLNDKVFIENNIIIGKAPTLNYIEVDL